MERRIAIGITLLATLAWLGAGVGGTAGRVAFAFAMTAMPVLLLFGSARGSRLRYAALCFGLIAAGMLLVVAWPGASIPQRVLALLLGGVLLPWILTVVGVLGEPRDPRP